MKPIRIGEITIGVLLAGAIVFSLVSERIGWTEYTPTSTTDHSFSPWPIAAALAVLLVVLVAVDIAKSRAGAGRL